jgi:hypothetical protein
MATAEAAVSATLVPQETEARAAISKQYDDEWESHVLGTYRRVAADYNKKIDDYYRPIFDQLLRQAETGPR